MVLSLIDDSLSLLLPRILVEENLVRVEHQLEVLSTPQSSESWSRVSSEAFYEAKIWCCRSSVNLSAYFYLEF